VLHTVFWKLELFVFNSETEIFIFSYTKDYDLKRFKV
jgi:hypothetical protein